MNPTEEPAPKKKRLGVRTLHSADDVRRLLGRLIKARLADDGIDDGCLRALTGACSVLLKSIEQSDLDTRLADIEKQLAAYEQERHQ